MAAFQKHQHIRAERLAIAGTYITPVEVPETLPEDATFEEIIEAHNGLLATLVAAGILKPHDAPQDAPAAE